MIIELKNKLLFYILKLLKVGDIMIAVYASLIIAGEKKLSEVPKTLKEKVKACLISMDLEFLTLD